MAATKVQKTILLPLDMLQKVDQIAQKNDLRFALAFEMVMDYGLKEVERRTAPAAAASP